MLPINIQKSPSTGRYIVKLSSSAISNSTCFKKFWLTVISGYREPVMPNDVEFGTAFHLFIADVARGKSVPASIEKAQDYFLNQPNYCKKSYLTREYLSEVCNKYYEEVYRKDSIKTVCIGDEPLVEKNFAIPVSVTDTAEYLLCGTMDRIVSTGTSERLSILDYKTTGKYVKSSDTFFLEKELSTQLITYTVAMEYLAKEDKTGTLRDLLKHRPSSLIEGIFIPSGSTIEFKRSKYITFMDAQISEWMNCLEGLILLMDLYLQSPDLTIPRSGMFNGACGGGYSLCKFFSSCVCPDDRAGLFRLQQEFISLQYDPLNHGKLIKMEDRFLKLANSNYEKQH